MKLHLQNLLNTRLLILFGFLFGFYPVIYSIASGYSVEDALFEFAYYRIEDALSLRSFERYFIPFALLTLVAKQRFVVPKTNASKDYNIAINQFLIGYFLAFSLLFILLDMSFFFGSVASMPLVLGLLIVVFALDMLLINTQLLDIVKKSIEEKKSALNKIQFLALIEVAILLAAGLALALPNTWAMS